jgi:hypothetical protein
MGDICKELKVIPQFVGSCWFNSFLMAILYSENARKVMINYSKKWDKKDKFFNILKNILKKNYSDPKIAYYYNQMQPQLILFKFLKKIDLVTEKNIKSNIRKDLSSFGWSHSYFTKFVKFVNHKTLDIYYNKSKDHTIINFHKNILFDRNDNKIVNSFVYKKINIEKEKKEIINLITEIPDFLILYHSVLFEKKIIMRAYDVVKSKNPEEANVYNFDSYNYSQDGIKEHRDFIYLNNVKYKLDSCIIGNYDDGEIQHSIVGITCNGERYVYNGWINTTYDPAMKEKILLEKSFPCSLIKYHWDLNSTDSFCLNPNECKLNFKIDKTKLCFSFGKGERILLYVRVDNNDLIKTTELSTLTSSKVQLSNLKEIIKDIYQIDNLNRNELNRHLYNIALKEQKIDKEIFNLDNKSIEELRDILLNKLLLNYDIYKKRITRKEVYSKFKHLKDHKGTLLKQQVFLTDFIHENYSSIDKMLLFHGIGTGKTCTSITIAESIMDKNKLMKVLVILPARLKTNFIDELISQTCGFDRYISKTDFDKYINIQTTKKEKEVIRKKFMKKINENYTIISYESLRNLLMKTNNIKELILEITKNKIIIIDEIHNLITTRIKIETIVNIIKSNKIPKNTKMINGVIMRLMTLLADKTSKFFLLTATPVFDNYGQFIELVMNLCPDIKESEIKRNVNDLDFLLKKIRGKVSFYKLNDLNAYPDIIKSNIEIPLSKTQDKMISNITSDNSLDFSTLFCVTERQLSISTYSIENKSKVFSNLDEYAPKLKKLFELLELPGKHVVYSNFINYCLHLIAAYLKENGWNDYLENGSKNYKTFIIWDASLDDTDKQDIKSILNSVSNIDGKIIRVVLGSPSIKEGISFKHVQHLHQIDPVWNSSAKAQIEGRCIRYKSHEDIPLNHPILKRVVHIHNYISVSRNNGLIAKTCDYKIYFEIITKKLKVIQIIENLLKKVSVDYYLWDDNKKPSRSSNISLLSRDRDELLSILDNKKVKPKINKLVGNNCPVKRRPFNNEKCLNKDYPYMRKNPKGFNCCYKKAK